MITVTKIRLGHYKEQMALLDVHNGYLGVEYSFPFVALFYENPIAGTLQIRFCENLVSTEMTE